MKLQQVLGEMIILFLSCTKSSFFARLQKTFGINRYINTGGYVWDGEVRCLRWFLTGRSRWFQNLDWLFRIKTHEMHEKSSGESDEWEERLQTAAGKLKNQHFHSAPTCTSAPASSTRPVNEALSKAWFCFIEITDDAIWHFNEPGGDLHSAPR